MSLTPQQQQQNNLAYTELSHRMSRTMDGAIDQVVRGERLTEVTMERAAGEDTPEADTLYTQLLGRLQGNGIRARWASDAAHAGITVAFGLG